MKEVVLFCLVTGIFSTIALDIWGALALKVSGRMPTNWGMVGRWLTGLPHGQWVLRGDDPSAPRTGEYALGWIFHYLVGISYSVLLLLICGTGFVQAPRVLPVLFVGVVVSSLAGLMILMPGMGGGVFGCKLPNQRSTIIYVLVAHLVYALALYAAAQAVAHMV